jgi:outer membrane protein assembly factor BamB
VGSGWATLGKDSARTSQGDSVGPTAPEILWQFEWEDPGTAPNDYLLILPDGTVILNADYFGFVALHGQSGKEKWRSEPLDGRIQGVPTLTAANEVVFATSDEVRVLSPDGKLARKWRAASLDEVEAVAVAPNGDYLVSAEVGELARYSSAGTERWRVPIPGGTKSTPTVAEDGTAYITNTEKHVFAVTASGDISWKAEVDDAYDATITIHSSGNLLVPTHSQSLHVFTPSGELAWTVEDCCRGAQVATARDGRIYEVRPGTFEEPSRLNARDASGALLWTWTEDAPQTVPVVDSEGNVYAANQGATFSLAPDGTKRWHVDVGASALALSPDGSLVLIGFRSAVKLGDKAGVEPASE